MAPTPNRFATPIPTSMTLREARDIYVRENGFRLNLYTEPRLELSFGRLRFRMPNPIPGRDAVLRHDLHHVLTGYGTDVAGEIEIAAWESAAGLGRVWIAWAITFPTFLVGLLLLPRHTWRAFVLGRGCRSLYLDDSPYATLLSLGVGEARERLAIPASGIAERPARVRWRFDWLRG